MMDCVQKVRITYTVYISVPIRTTESTIRQARKSPTLDRT